jgi:hypothetical protein
MNTVCVRRQRLLDLAQSVHAEQNALQFGSVFSTLCVDGFVMVSSRLFVQLISYGHDPYAIMCGVCNIVYYLIPTY